LSLFLLPSLRKRQSVRVDKDNVIRLDAVTPSLRHSEDWGPDADKTPRFAAGFVNMGLFCSLACDCTLSWVKRHGTTHEFPRSVRQTMERWAHDNIKGLVSFYFSVTGFVQIEAKDDWASFRYEITLNPSWLEKGFGT